MSFHATGHNSTPYLTAPAPPSFPNRPRTSILTVCRGPPIICAFTLEVEMLPDDVLLEIFDFYVDKDVDEYSALWIALAHVCRRWRSLVFRSPCRLNLRLVCTPDTRSRRTLDIWPPLPLIISDTYIDRHDYDERDNIIAALEHNDRVCQIKLHVMASELESLTNSAAMQKPFPELTDMHLSCINGREPILPDSESFLAGTAPGLRSLKLDDVPFPGIPKLLLSATHLVRLDLGGIPPSGYIPPEVMATSLTTLTSLDFLGLEFRHPRPRPVLENRRPPPIPHTRSILPNLTKIQFGGASEYLEEIFARIDAPRLDRLLITFFNQMIFDTPQLFRFISQRSTLRTLEEGYITVQSNAIIVRFRSQTSGYDVLRVQIQSRALEWQLSSLEQVCTSSLPSVSTLEDLYVFEFRQSPPRWQNDVEYTLWLDLFRSFIAVKNLYLSKKFVRRIAPALQELVGGRTTEMLPTLENIFLEGFQPSRPLHEGIEKFVAARRLTSHPVAVSPFDRARERHQEIFGY